MAFPLARTNSEAHAYMELHPCECGATGQDLTNSMVEADGELVSRYAGDCGCGTFREYVFRLPDVVPMPQPGSVVYGDGMPSELLDPGEWLWLADRNASAVPADLSGLDRAALRRARLRISAADAAIGEVLAFMPDSAESMPLDSFGSDRGGEVYRREPGRFDRARLDVVRIQYRRLLADLDRAIAT